MTTGLLGGSLTSNSSKTYVAVVDVVVVVVVVVVIAALKQLLTAEITGNTPSLQNRPLKSSMSNVL